MIQVLRTIPFDKVDIKILDIEMNHVGQIFEGTASDLRRHLEKNGYEAFMRVGIDEVSLLAGKVNVGMMSTKFRDLLINSLQR